MSGLEIIGAFATIVSVLQAWKASGRSTKSLKAQGMRDLSAAVAKTKQVIAERSGKPPFPDVVQAWEKASISMAEAKQKGLSHLCRIKSLYWLNPLEWSDEEVYAAGIQLTAMERELRRLLASESKPQKKNSSGRAAG